MTKHYKQFSLWLCVLLVLGALFIWATPYLRIAPAVPVEYQSLANRYAAKYSLSPTLVYSVMKVESNFDPDARSHQNAYGLMQITEDTLKWAILREGNNAPYTAQDLFDPEINIKYGCYILSLLLQEFEDPGTALAAYNAGRSNVIKWLKDSRYSHDGLTLYTTPYKETTQYMQKVLAYEEKYQKMLGEVR